MMIVCLNVFIAFSFRKDKKGLSYALYFKIIEYSIEC